MFRSSIIAGIGLSLCACVLASCENLSLHNRPNPEPISTERKTLQRLNLAPDAVVFDVLVAHVPYNERDLVRDLWKDVDELALEPTARRALNEQGFRAGLLGASTPESLSKLLALKGRELRSSIEEQVDSSKVESTLAPIAYSKPVTLRSGTKSTIVARTDVIPSAPILEKREDGALEGKTYADVSPVFSVAVEQSPDGSTLFNVAPFLRYGAAKPVTRYQHGQLVKTQEQPTKSFDSLRFSAALRPGQFLVIGATDANSNALGRYFFNEGGDDFEQTILVLRLLVTQRDGQIDRFPAFKEMIADGDGDYLDDFSDSFQQTAPDIVPTRDSASPTDGGGFDNYDALELGETPELDDDDGTGTPGNF